MAVVAEKPRGNCCAGGDPQVLRIPVFVLGSIGLGLALLGFPATFAACSRLIVMGRVCFCSSARSGASFLGMSFVAAVFGIFSAFLAEPRRATARAVAPRDWFGVKTAADGAAAAQAFYVTWAILIFLAFIPTLRLPLIYPLIFHPDRLSLGAGGRWCRCDQPASSSSRSRGRGAYVHQRRLRLVGGKPLPWTTAPA